MKKVIILSISVLLIFALNAFAQPDSPGEGTKVASPPPPFLKACAFQSEGAPCTFYDQSGAAVHGNCALRANPRGGQEMVCFNEAFFKKMDRGKRGERTGPELMN
jgi:hypothetical protein